MCAPQQQQLRAPQPMPDILATSSPPPHVPISFAPTPSSPSAHRKRRCPVRRAFCWSMDGRTTEEASRARASHHAGGPTPIHSAILTPPPQHNDEGRGRMMRAAEADAAAAAADDFVCVLFVKLQGTEHLDGEELGMDSSRKKLEDNQHNGGGGEE
ncbi:hypothetical protein niasHT_004337 [Heterodera trifolii]|uniref:Uncharacterized protein n=1 Tax=Heterodera trifolii TaxID=157864 RepID=A0ABD2LRZ8_9BILA